MNIIEDGYSIQLEAESGMILKNQDVNVQSPISFENLTYLMQRGDMICE